MIGRSLIWVAILGLVVFYLYGIISFAMMRSMFDPDDYLYCASLWECTITVIRYGLIGDMFEVFLFKKWLYMIIGHRDNSEYIHYFLIEKIRFITKRNDFMVTSNCLTWSLNCIYIISSYSAKININTFNFSYFVP